MTNISQCISESFMHSIFKLYFDPDTYMKMISHLSFFLFCSILIMASAFPLDYDDSFDKISSQELRNYLISHARLLKNHHQNSLKMGNIDEIMRFSRSRSKFTPDLARPRFGKRNDNTGFLDNMYSLESLNQIED